MNNEMFELESIGVQPNYFTQIPNMALYELSASAYKLLAVYLDMSKTGSIFARSKIILERFGASTNTMKKARQELADKGYIKFSKGSQGKGIKTTLAKVAVMINWMWAENNKRMSNPDTLSGNRVSNSDTPLSEFDNIEQEPLKQEQKAVPPPQNSFNRNPDFAKVVQSHEQWFGAITSGIADILNMWLEEYSSEWICESFEESAKNNVRRINYAKAILERWAIEGRNKETNTETKADWLDAGNANWGETK